MEEINLKEMFEFFWKKKVVIVVVIFLAIVVSILYTKFVITPLYESSTSLILTKTNFETEADVESYAKMVDRYVIIANSKDVMQKAIENLQLDLSIADLKNSVTVTSAANAYCFRITVKNTNPEDAAKITDELAKVTIEKIEEVYNDDTILILDSATINFLPVNINLVKNIVIFSIVAAIIVVGYIMILYIFYDKINMRNNKNK